MTADHSGPSISTADPIAAGYSAGASAVNGATLAARPGADVVLGEHPIPVSVDELGERVAALHDLADALLAGVATLRDVGVDESVTARLDAATQHVGRAARELHGLRYPVPVRDEE